MKKSFVLLSILLAAVVYVQVIAQKGDQQKQGQSKDRDQQEDSIKIDTNLVTVPVIASDRNDIYIPDLKKEELSIYEDGAQQEIVFFATIKEPFNVVLMLDTSASAQEKLGQIQRAANAFVNQLQPADRVKVISFDDKIHELSEFTNDRATLRSAINGAKPGEGTKMYDAVKLALNNLSRVKGRKAIVIFTDGVDWRSDSTRYDDNIKMVEESGVIVYPIRYDTRPETEEMLRTQQETIGETDLGIIFGGPNNRVPRGTTPPTTPGGSPIPGGPGSRTGRNDPYQLPIPPINIPVPGNRYPDSRYPGGGNRYPDDRYPGGGGRFPDDRNPGGNRYPDTRNPGGTGGAGGGGYPSDPTRYPDSRRRGNDTLTVMLDNLYAIGDQYLQEIALKSGGKLHRADTLKDLPDAFAKIAEELRNQYSIGYYPSNAARDGRYRKIQVKSTRKDAVVRARPGYRAPKGK